MTNNIELRNENGKIVGYDSDGNKIPVSFEHGEFDSINAGRVAIEEQQIVPRGNQAASRHIYHGPRTIEQKSELLNSAALSWTSNDIYWPSVVKADEIFDSSLGTYYMYYSEDHVSGSGIGVAYADNPMGPWTDYGEVLSPYTDENETPTAVYDPTNDRLNLYFHSKNIGITQSTALATTPTSGDGTSFSNQGLVLEVPDDTPGDGHTGYLSVSRIGEQWVGYHLMGGTNLARFGVSYSNDGVDWDTDPRPLVNNADITNDINRRIEWSHSNIVNWGGSLRWFGSVSPYSSGGNRGQKVICTAPMKSTRQLSQTPRTLIEPTQNWEGNGVITPDVLTDGTDSIIYYASGGAIGAVKLTEGTL